MDPILECQHRQHCRLFQPPWGPCCSTNPCLSGTEDPSIWANGAAAQGMAQDGRSACLLTGSAKTEFNMLMREWHHREISPGCLVTGLGGNREIS